MRPCNLPSYLLRFEPLVEGEAAIEVPCDAAGQVDLDELEEADRNAYFYAHIARHLRFIARVIVSAKGLGR